MVATLVSQMIAPAMAKGDRDTDASSHTRTPIKHVIVIIGENRTFDHVFATYKPRNGERVDNLLSKQIINEDGTPGASYALATQFSAHDTHDFELSPGGKSVYPVLPAPLAGGPKDVCVNNGICTMTDATTSENGLAPGYYQYLLTGGTGLTGRTPDTRITNVHTLPPGPFQLTNATTFPYDAYAASPVHRFYQMWQQFDCSLAYSLFWNPSGCLADLFPWVEVTVGAGANGIPQPANFSTNWSPTASTTGEGSTAMGFYNVLQGDAPYFKFLADRYAMSDNFHQSVMGGTGANHIMLGTGDAMWFSDGQGHAAKPPHNQVVYPENADAGTVDEIANPNPAAGPNNWYTEDGYGGGGFGKPV
jgi:phospholipase C